MAIQQHKGGRGRKAPDDERRRGLPQISFRPLDEERDEIERAAERAGLTLSSYALDRVLRAARRENRRAQQ